jgi:hypothetical protein
MISLIKAPGRHHLYNRREAISKYMRIVTVVGTREVARGPPRFLDVHGCLHFTSTAYLMLSSKS